jgi:adenine-specific DNA-methyltransferase
MSARVEHRETIVAALKAFESQPLAEAGRRLLAILGYRSDRTIHLGDSNPRAFLDFIGSHAGEARFDANKALFSDWKSADLLFQLTDDELSSHASLFQETSVQPGLLRSYLFFAIELTGDHYARGKLTGIARQINRIFPMPVMVLIKHISDGRPTISIAVINRRQNKRDAARDVLGKVTIIRGIAVEAPHRGHLDILSSFALQNLVHPQRLAITNFDTLHSAWEQIFNVEVLNERFYRELANWYFWALPQVEFPADTEPEAERRRATSLIRLLTRLIFCWFLKEKGLIPENLFVEAELGRLLIDLSPGSSTYYQAILQNLFFATLNQRMGNDKSGHPYRAFARNEGFEKNRATYGVDTLYRYEEHFHDPLAALLQFADVPFLNGGLFECLDRTEEGTGKKLYLDGFSRNKAKRPSVPNRLFFAEEQTADLSDAYGEPRRRNEKVRGLLSILHSYKFTIVENTPIDQEIALDPELLGKVFENLLASYNEETKTTARKQTGSFYTPRSIVEYMVDESLKAHLSAALAKGGMSEIDAKTGLEILFAYTEREHPFTESEADTLLEAIHTCKILDPACGSGAFPMGMLQKLVYIIHKLDPANAKWMQLQIDAAAKVPDPSAREAAIAAIERNFTENEDDYGRKLYLIENCLYGVDIQPIAIQISKLRFFISLVCDQRTHLSKDDNHGVRPLPNLETKFVAADTLIGLGSERQLDLELLASPAVKRLEGELQRVRHDHFAATTRQHKLALQKRDRDLREELARHLIQLSFADRETSRKVASWDPYDPQKTAGFFDPLWMFDQSLADGFSLIIGNPPYISVERFAGTPIQSKWQSSFATYAGRGDVYCFFYERGAALLQPGGTLTYITSNKWMRAAYGKNLRDFLLKHTRIDELLDFGGILAFNAATVDTCVLRLSRNKAAKSAPFSYMPSSFAFDRSLAEFTEQNSVSFSLPQDPAQSWAVLSPGRQNIRRQVSAKGVPLEKWDIQISRGIITGFNEAYYLTKEQRDALIAEDPTSQDLIVKLIRGREVERYHVDWEDTYQLIVEFGAHTYLEMQYPAVFRHLTKFETQLRARGQCRYGRAMIRDDEAKSYPGQHHWLELDNNPGKEYLNAFLEPKIIYPEITKRLGFFLDRKDNYYPNNKAFIISSKGDSLAYLTAFFNSSLFRAAYIDEFPTQGEDRRELRKVFFEKLVVLKPTAEQRRAFEMLVPLVQLAKGGGGDAAAQFLEDLIDACVMECYFRDHMGERDVLFLDELVPHLDAYERIVGESKQQEFLVGLYRSLNAPDAKVRNRLLRLTADSPQLLGAIKEEGRV